MIKTTYKSKNVLAFNEPNLEKQKLVMLEPTQKFYSDAEDYWAKIPPTIDGMLGGFGFISPTDIQGSKVFLQQLFRSKTPPGRSYAVDCGAGIGRVSKNLLVNHFDHVDLVEQSPIFLEKAKIYLGPKILPKVGNFYPIGLQDFQPESNKYDVIWVQWVLGHLTDAHFVQFFEVCKKGLKPNGMIVVKENTSSGEVDMDVRDSSVTRPLSTLKKLFTKAGLECYRQLRQTSFPKELYNVYMFALKPSNVICEAGVIDHLDNCSKNIEISVTEQPKDLCFSNDDCDNAQCCTAAGEKVLELNGLKNECNVPDMEKSVN